MIDEWCVAEDDFAYYERLLQECLRFLEGDGRKEVVSDGVPAKQGTSKRLDQDSLWLPFNE